MADVEARIAELIEPSLIGMGYELVRVQYAQGTLQIMAEKADDGDMTVEDCAEISHTVSALLDVSDPIKSHYLLEISSPGMDRPLVRLSDYERFSGEPARIDMQKPVDGRKRFLGHLGGANGVSIRLILEDESLIELPFADIHHARLDVSRELAAPQPKPGKTKAPKAKKAAAKKAAAPVSGESEDQAGTDAAPQKAARKSASKKKSDNVKKTNGEVVS